MAMHDRKVNRRLTWAPRKWHTNRPLRETRWFAAFMTGKLRKIESVTTAFIVLMTFLTCKTG